MVPRIQTAGFTRGGVVAHGDDGGERGDAEAGVPADEKSRVAERGAGGWLS
jgi:hypothetical protein